MKDRASTGDVESFSSLESLILFSLETLYRSGKFLRYISTYAMRFVTNRSPEPDSRLNPSRPD